MNNEALINAVMGRDLQAIDLLINQGQQVDENVIAEIKDQIKDHEDDRVLAHFLYNHLNLIRDYIYEFFLLGVSSQDINLLYFLIEFARHSDVTERIFELIIMYGDVCLIDDFLEEYPEMIPLSIIYTINKEDKGLITHLSSKYLKIDDLTGYTNEELLIEAVDHVECCIYGVIYEFIDIVDSEEIIKRLMSYYDIDFRNVFNSLREKGNNERLLQLASRILPIQDGLLIAVETGNYQLVEELLELGADVEIDQTPLLKAHELGNWEIVKLLGRYGAPLQGISGDYWVEFLAQIDDPVITKEVIRKVRLKEDDLTELMALVQENPLHVREIDIYLRSIKPPESLFEY